MKWLTCFCNIEDRMRLCRSWIFKRSCSFLLGLNRKVIQVLKYFLLNAVSILHFSKYQIIPYQVQLRRRWSIHFTKKKNTKKIRVGFLQKYIVLWFQYLSIQTQTELAAKIGLQIGNLMSVSNRCNLGACSVPYLYCHMTSLKKSEENLTPRINCLPLHRTASFPCSPVPSLFCAHYFFSFKRCSYFTF